MVCTEVLLNSWMHENKTKKTNTTTFLEKLPLKDKEFVESPPPLVIIRCASKAMNNLKKNMKYYQVS